MRLEITAPAYGPPVADRGHRATVPVIRTGRRHPHLHSGRAIPREASPPYQAMTKPLLRPRTRRATTVFLSDAMLDQLDSLVAILPDAPNRSRLIKSFLEMQLALLLNPTVALPLFLEGFHANLMAVANAETLAALEVDGC